LILIILVFFLSFRYLDLSWDIIFGFCFFYFLNPSFFTLCTSFKFKITVQKENKTFKKLKI